MTAKIKTPKLVFLQIIGRNASGKEKARHDNTQKPQKPTDESKNSQQIQFTRQPFHPYAPWQASNLINQKHPDSKAGFLYNNLFGLKAEVAIAKAFLGSTCNGSHWCDQFVTMLRCGHFNPAIGE